MNEAQSFAEVFAWFQGFEFVVLVATGVALLAYQLPAYRRWRTRPLLLLVMAGLLDLFGLVFDKTFGQHGPTDPNDWWAYWIARELVWLATIVLSTTGALLFLRDYGRLAAAASPPPLPPKEATADSPAPPSTSDGNDA